MDRVFCHFGPFLPFDPPSNPKNQNFERMKKNKIWRYHHFTLVYHKWQSYDVWFLRYGVGQTSFFVIFGLYFAIFTKSKIENRGTLRRNSRNTQENRRNTRRNTWKHHGKQEMARKLGKHNIKGITTIIMQKRNRQLLTILHVYLMCTKFAKFSIFYNETYLRLLLIENFYKSNE